MKTETFEQQSKSQKIHTYEDDAQIFPFAILEEQTHAEDADICTYQVIIGNMKCEEKVFESLVECENYILSKPYSLIISLFLHMQELYANFKQNLEFIKEEQKLKSNENE